MKKFNKFTDEASYTSFIQNIAEPGYYTSWVVGNLLNIGDDIYSDGTNFYNYAAEGTELIGNYCGKINDTYYLKAPSAIYRGYFLTLDGYNPTAAYPENISSYNSFENIPYNVYRGREFFTGNTSYPSDEKVYGVTDVKERLSLGNKISNWEGYWLNNYNPGTTSYYFSAGNGNMFRSTIYGEWIELIPNNISWEVTYPEGKWYTEENYRAWAIEKLILYRDNMVDNWEIPSNKLNLGNDVFYYETAALLNEIKDLIPVLPFLIDLEPFHYDYVEELLHIYSENTVVISDWGDNVKIEFVPDTNNKVYAEFDMSNMKCTYIENLNKFGQWLGYPSNPVYKDRENSIKLFNDASLTNLINEIYKDSSASSLANWIKIGTYDACYMPRLQLFNTTSVTLDGYIDGKRNYYIIYQDLKTEYKRLYLTHNNTFGTNTVILIPKRYIDSYKLEGKYQGFDKWYYRTGYMYTKEFNANKIVVN